jgi:hypothetical protein
MSYVGIFWQFAFWEDSTHLLAWYNGIMPGRQLVALMILVTGASRSVSSIQALDLKDGSLTTLFKQASSQMLAHDLSLTWGPDSQTVAATEIHMLSQDGPISATLADPAAMLQYVPSVVGRRAWRADSQAFVLQNADATNVADVPGLYMFTTGDIHGQLLLTDAQDFVWD